MGWKTGEACVWARVAGGSFVVWMCRCRQPNEGQLLPRSKRDLAGLLHRREHRRVSKQLPQTGTDYSNVDVFLPGMRTVFALFLSPRASPRRRRISACG